MMNQSHVRQINHDLLQINHAGQDLRLASLVGSGKLRDSGGAIVDALLKSVLLKATRNCEKRPNSSKYFNDELGAELVFTLGRGQCLKEVLKLLGQKMRKTHI